MFFGLECSPCCSGGSGICWAGNGIGNLFPSGLNDRRVSATTGIQGCKVVVDYFAVQCPFENGYDYMPAAMVSEFLSNGGIYITHCEWTNCTVSSGCDPTGSGLNNHMSAIGCSIHRGRGTISTAPGYQPLGSALYTNSTISGNATSEILGGTPLLSSVRGGGCPSEPGGICCAGEVVNSGAVIVFGDSNIYIYGNFRQNLLTILPSDLFGNPAP